ncbi:DNA-directed RNA polymerase subunit alpha [Calothrix sp. NIES-3974]|uniref:DNA-directed RNA polymerase subunit alpha n=1 Tax=Calothrix sp. NIES-3974 TaxID=2005462 RepID=UPI000B60C34D|nr:DNA-directed RNA polymerase subunit alpha [Calothrix sp. NIES-3974]BAZ04006.1 DNA-directed RNA polymerase, alpha subunit RpoA [Calothrix sp. NIES-3974]
MAQFQIECLESASEESRNHYSRFIIEPLERGQGTTVGNALRRVLLSNLEGTAVTAVRIQGVSHEFATVPGVREDVLEILMRMKEVVLKSYSSQPQIGRLLVHAQSPGSTTVTTAHFDLPSEVEVIDPTQYIASLAEGAKLEMEFRIERGKGYRTVERSREEATSIDFLQIDSVFMPVRKVNYSVEETRGENGIPKDRLLLEVWTNGSISPQEALSSAAGILVDLFNPLKDFTYAEQDTGIVEDLDPTAQIPIEELQLSVRAYNCLKRAQVNSVADLLDYTQEDLLEIKNFGQKSAEEVVEALQRRLGITLPTERASKHG